MAPTASPTNEVPSLESVLSAPDFEVVASKALTPKTWAFYSSAATDLITHSKNKELVRRIMIRPRILRNVTSVNMKTSILGFKTAPATQPFFFQLYINSERQKTIDILKSARSLGIKAIFVTVDAPVPGKREADERAAQAVTVRSAISGGESSKDKKGSGLGRLMAQYIDKSLTWDDLSWIREASGVPIVLKGVQTADDAKMAVEYGVDAILLSNHGGRSLDGYVVATSRLAQS
ncbi:hypothetical protein ACHAPW_005121 [Verticillium nonalfalfae]